MTRTPTSYQTQSEEFFDALMRRDRSYEGRFVYGVATTNVYCRPACASRRPLRKNVAFFGDVRGAQAAGFRACKRCRPDEAASVDARLLRACRAIEASGESPKLAELAAVAGMSKSHFQRRFTREIGVSPKAYAQALRQRRLREGLQANASVTEAIYEAGFESASTVYTGAAQTLGMTPAQFRARGDARDITYTIVESALGHVLVAATGNGICRVDIGEPRDLERRLRAEFSKANLERSDDRLESTTSLIVTYLAGDAGWPLLPLDIRATAFQRRVWDALRAIAPGATMTYGALARAIGSPEAARAVARACATNPVALLIPCHRIVPAAGGVGGYRWDPRRKSRLLELERPTAESKAG